MIDAVRAARDRIAPHLAPSPLVHSHTLSDAIHAEVWLKLECLQATGSFKPRGALNKLACLGAEALTRGVVAASAGNHALGVAFACRALGVTNAELFVQANAAPAKVRKLRRYPVTLHLIGETYDEAEAAAKARAEETGAIYVPAYDDDDVIAGHGTVGLEIAEAMPDLDLVVVPVGGGALIAGIATAVRALLPNTRVVGVNPEASPSALASLRAGRALDPFAHAPTRAHGLAGGFGQRPFAIVKEAVSAVVLVSEREIAAGVRALIDSDQILAEPSGIVAVAALVAGRVDVPAGSKVVAVVSGGNLDAVTLAEMLAETA